MRTAPALLAAAALAACSPAGPDARPEFRAEVQQGALAATNGVTGGALMTHVQSLYNAHKAETPVVFPLQDLPQTRVSSAAYVASQWTAMGLTPTTEGADANDKELRNVYVDLPGATKPGELVLVGAHHDAWYGGADDNSTGVAVVIEAARALKGVAHDRTIRLVAFDDEERGLIGSQAYARRHAADKVVFSIVLDAVGYASHAANSQTSPAGLNLPPTGDFLAVVGSTGASAQVVKFMRLAARVPDALPLIGAVPPAEGKEPATSPFFRSDHASLWAVGIPGLFLTDTANFRNANYHTATDTPDTVDATFLQGVGRITTAAALAFATAE